MASPMENPLPSLDEDTGETWQELLIKFVKENDVL